MVLKVIRVILALAGLAAMITSVEIGENALYRYRGVDLAVFIALGSMLTGAGALVFLWAVGLITIDQNKGNDK